MDKLNLMHIFIAVVDTNGLAGAARKLGISPPVVTRAINELETVLGVRLLARTTRVVRVTEAGARYVEDCRRIVAELAEADASVGGMHGAPRGHLTVTAPVLFGALHVTPIVCEYLQRHPEVNSTCIFLDRVVNLLDEGIDVAVRIGELADSSMQAIRVGTVRRVICAAPNYLKKHGTPQSPSELARHSIIAANSVTQTTEWQCFDQGKLRHVKLTPRLSCTSNDAALAAAVSGFGLTRLLSYQAAEQVAKGKLKLVLDDYGPPPIPIHVVHREGRQPPQRVRAFLDLTIERLRENKALNP